VLVPSLGRLDLDNLDIDVIFESQCTVVVLIMCAVVWSHALATT